MVSGHSLTSFSVGPTMFAVSLKYSDRDKGGKNNSLDGQGKCNCFLKSIMDFLVLALSPHS